MRKNFVGILICILFLISACSNVSIAKPQNPKNRFGDIVIRFTSEWADITVNNIPPDTEYISGLEWVSTLFIDYSQGEIYEFDVLINVQVDCGDINFWSASENGNGHFDIVYMYPNEPPNFSDSVTKIIPKGNYYISFDVFVYVNVYEYINGQKIWYNYVEDYFSYFGHIRMSSSSNLN